MTRGAEADPGGLANAGAALTGTQAGASGWGGRRVAAGELRWAD